MNRLARDGQHSEVVTNDSANVTPWAIRSSGRWASGRAGPTGGVRPSGEVAEAGVQRVEPLVVGVDHDDVRVRRRVAAAGGAAATDNAGDGRRGQQQEAGGRGAGAPGGVRGAWGRAHVGPRRGKVEGPGRPVG